MSSYTRYDFSESLDRESITPDKIKKVLAAWGNVDKEGACCDACGGEWTGGFLLLLKDKRYVYLTGWCDYTGWGCQDGTTLTHYAEKPKLSDLENFPSNKWDIDPTDLNKWLQEGAKTDKVY